MYFQIPITPILKIKTKKSQIQNQTQIHTIFKTNLHNKKSYHILKNKQYQK